MTSRLLLTLLALFTGLSAQGGTVHARAAMPGTMLVAGVSTLAIVQSAKVEAVLARPAPELGRGRIASKPIRVMLQSVAPIPAVLTRIDRARE